MTAEVISFRNNDAERIRALWQAGVESVLRAPAAGGQRGVARWFEQMAATGPLPRNAAV